MFAKNREMTPGEAPVRNLPATPRTLCGGDQVLCIRHGGVAVGDGDLGVAARRLAAGPAGIVEHPLRHFGKLGNVLIDERIALAPESGEPVLDIGRIARLAHFAVIDDIDTGARLKRNHLGNRRLHPRRQSIAVDRDTFFLGIHDLDEIFGARQAADMGRENSLLAAYHRGLPPSV